MYYTTVISLAMHDIVDNKSTKINTCQTQGTSKLLKLVPTNNTSLKVQCFNDSVISLHQGSTFNY